MQRERDLRGVRGDASELVSEFAIKLLEQDVRPTAIIQDLRILYGTGKTLDEGVIFKNEAFKTMIWRQSSIWSEKILNKLLDVDCPGEVEVAASGVRFRVMDVGLDVGCGMKVRGVVVMDYYLPPKTNGSKERRNTIAGICLGETKNGVTRITEKPNLNTTATIESNFDNDSSDEDNNPSPQQLVPKSYSHHMLITPRMRSAPPSSEISGTNIEQERKRVGLIDPSKVIFPADCVQYLPIMPNWEAAAEYFERIGRGGRWIPGSAVGEETEAEWEADSRKKQEERPLLDWTHPDFFPLPQYSAKHYEHLLAIDWSKTNLGPRETWDACLLTMVTSIMTTAYPTAVYWGPEYTILYNEHFVAIAQNRSPYILGKTFAAGWPELASYFIPILDKAYYHGEATVKQEELLHIVGRVPDVEQEESYFNFIMCPVVGSDGRTVGVLEQALEVTREVMSNRRMGFLRYLGETLARVDFSVSGEFLKKVFQAFETTPDNGVWNDTPFMGLYGLGDPEIGKCTLVGSIGLPKYLAPDSCDLFSRPSRDTPNDIFVEAMREVIETGESVLVKLDKEVSQDIETRGKGKLCRFAILIPIQAARGLIRGFLILGINPQRPFDDDYRFWVGLLKTELSSTAGREELLNAEIRKGIDAEIQKTERARTAEVQDMLDTRTKELRESELLFTKTAETIPVGLALISLSGDLMFTNTAYHALSTLPREDNNPEDLTWRDIIYPEDRERVYRIFDDAVSKASSAQWEARTGMDPERGWKHWVSCSMVVQSNESTGELTGYMLTLSDITQVKLAEEYERKLSAQAVEKRRQQENFIDIFSHELRNPFSATLQCADGILAAVTEYQLKGGDLDVEDIADASSTILVCVQHQMRIINDVLTLSKLDSMLLSVIPVDVQIHESILTTLKIFQSELQVKGIKAKFIIGDSYERLGLDWLKCDPSRFNQILVNLLTNAIKFTSFQSERCEITVTLDAYTERPKRNGNVVYTRPKPDEEGPEGDGEVDVDEISKVQGEEWGSGEPVYVHVEVQDTGIGISEHWQKKLFNRFEQVPKTHVTYGGSGLGLFICRKLCRLQGGRIGVASEEGKGSKFSFYITARRTNPPPGASSSRPNKVQVISDASAHGSSSSGLPWSGMPTGGHNSPVPGSFNGQSGIPEHIIATFIPEHITTPRLAAVRRVQSAMAAQSLASSTAITSPVNSPPPELEPRTEFTPHASTSCAMQSTLKTFKPLKSPSIQPQTTTYHPGYKVLIVEDNLINQEVLRRQLRKEGCIAHVANNGQEGLEFVENSEFGQEGGVEVDIVLMDMEMPVMDGNTATKMIRRMEAEGKLKRHVPILGISANARSEQVAEMIKAGMDDAISKPFRIVDLVAKFEILIENSKKPVGEESPVSEADTNRIIKQNATFEMSSLASILSSTTPRKTPVSNEAASPSYTLSPIIPLPPSSLDNYASGGSENSTGGGLSSPNIPSPTILPSPIQEMHHSTTTTTTHTCSPALSPTISKRQSRTQSPFMRADSMPLPYTRQNQDTMGPEVPHKSPPRSYSQSHSQSQQHQHHLIPSSLPYSPHPAVPPSQSIHNVPRHSQNYAPTKSK